MGMTVRMSTEQPWFLYLLRCADGKVYTGITPNVEKRLAEHRAGKGANFTRGRRRVELIYTERHPSKSAACVREREVKRWSRRKKLALIGTVKRT